MCRVACQITLYDEHELISNIPAHVSPSPVQPSLHVHSYEPSLFLQAAFVSQGLSEHSSMSIENISRAHKKSFFCSNASM